MLPLFSQQHEGGSVVALDAALAGTGALTATVGVERGLSATLAGAGTLAASVGVDRAIAAQLDGTGALTATATIERSLAASFSGTGALEGSLQMDRGLAATLVGTGSLAADVSAGDVELDAVLQGVAALSADLTVERGISAVLQGFGSFEATATVERGLTATMVGMGLLEAIPSVDRGLAASLSGSGELAGSLSFELALAAHLAGTGALTANMYVGLPVRSTLGIVERLLSLLEPDLLGHHEGLIAEAVDLSHSQPFTYKPRVLYCWESADRRSMIGTARVLQHSFEFTVAYGIDDHGEEAKMLGGDREVSDALDTKAHEYLEAIRHNQVTDEWDSIAATYMPDFLAAFGLRGFAIRIAGYRLL